MSGEAHRGAEVGRKLMERLGRELHDREIYDVVRGRMPAPGRPGGGHVGIVIVA